MGKSWPTPQMAFKASGIRSEKADCTDDKGRQCTDDKGRQQTRPNTPSPPPPPRHGHGAAQAWMDLTRTQCALHLTTDPPLRNAIACAAMLRVRTVLLCSVLHTCRTIPMPTPRLAPETATSLGAISLPFHEMPTHTGASCATTSATSSDRLIILRASPDSGRRNYRIDGWNHWRYYQIRNLLV